MFRLLSQPYPTEEPVRRRLIKAALISLFIGLFLLVFQPFGLHDWQTPAKMEKMLGFGLVTFGVMVVDSFLLPWLFPRYFSDSRWTVGKEIIRTLLLLFVIAIGNRIYLGGLQRKKIGSNNHRQKPDLRDFGCECRYDWLRRILTQIAWCVVLSNSVHFLWHPDRGFCPKRRSSV